MARLLRHDFEKELEVRCAAARRKKREQSRSSFNRLKGIGAL
jgi:hypothetical protein